MSRRTFLDWVFLVDEALDSFTGEQVFQTGALFLTFLLLTLLVDAIFFNWNVDIPSSVWVADAGIPVLAVICDNIHCAYQRSRLSGDFK